MPQKLQLRGLFLFGLIFFRSPSVMADCAKKFEGQYKKAFQASQSQYDSFNSIKPWNWGKQWTANADMDKYKFWETLMTGFMEQPNLKQIQDIKEMVDQKKNGEKLKGTIDMSSSGTATSFLLNTLVNSRKPFTMSIARDWFQELRQANVNEEFCKGDDPSKWGDLEEAIAKKVSASVSRQPSPSPPEKDGCEKVAGSQSDKGNSHDFYGTVHCKHNGFDYSASLRCQIAEGAVDYTHCFQTAMAAELANVSFGATTPSAEGAKSAF